MIEIAVIGGGASGLMAASLIKKNDNCRITVFEKMPRVGIKLSITGKGRCNVTTASKPSEMNGFIAHGNKFIRSALYSFTPQDTVSFFEDCGVMLKTERGGRIFPVSDKASDIVDALYNKAKENAVFKFEKVLSIEKKGDSFIVSTQNGSFAFDKVIIATGGVSYPKTGSSGDGYKFASKFGIKTVPVSPSLVPLIAKENYCGDLMGLSLKNTKADFFDRNGKKVYSDFGEMLFCHFGVSGPMILSASSHLDFNKGEEYKLILDLKPALDENTLDKRILRDFEEEKNKNYANSLSKLLPAKMIPVFISLSKIDPQKKVNSITKSERKNIVSLLKNFPLTIIGKRPIEEAIITAGGIDTSEIDSRRMESKKIKNLFFIGEVLDVDALTGGYNLQIAFSTAYLAARSVSEDL